MTSPIPPGRHRIVIISGSGGGNDAELSKLREIAEYDTRSQVWRTSLPTQLESGDLDRLQQLFRIATNFGASVRIEPPSPPDD